MGLEAPPGGYDFRMELTRQELEIEQLCDEERYRAMHTDEDEEEMYKGTYSVIPFSWRGRQRPASLLAMAGNSAPLTGQCYLSRACVVRTDGTH